MRHTHSATAHMHQKEDKTHAQTRRLTRTQGQGGGARTRRRRCLNAIASSPPPPTRRRRRSTPRVGGVCAKNTLTSTPGAHHVPRSAVKSSLRIASPSSSAALEQRTGPRSAHGASARHSPPRRNRASASDFSRPRFWAVHKNRKRFPIFDENRKSKVESNRKTAV